MLHFITKRKKYFAIGILVFIISCKGGKNTPDVSHIKVDATIHRFDQDFYGNNNDVVTLMNTMQQKYGNLFQFFLAKTAMADGLATGIQPALVVGEYKKINGLVYDSVQVQYKNLSWLENDFKKAFQYYKFYFSQFTAPKLFAFVDGIDCVEPYCMNGIDVGKDTLVISLQMYLGKNSTLYNPEQYYDYLRERFNKDYILKNSLTALLDKQFPYTATDAPLVEQMIERGKRVHLLDLLMPNYDDATKLGYTKQQLKECYKNEQFIWSIFINNNNLFTTESAITKDYLGEAPFTNELGKGSPGNIGNFVGWQIVKKYMEANKSVTPAQLMALDSKVIYRDAKYKP